jgi:cell division protein FtsZ
MVAGMGGAAGTEISQVVADVLRAQDILTLGATIIPFYSKNQRQLIAHSGVGALSHRINTVFPISNEIFAQKSGNDGAAMNQSSLVFTQLYRSIMNTIAMPGIIGVDIADVHCLMQGEGHSAFGFGSASGIHGAESATRKAIAHPLLAQRRLKQASGILVAIEGNCQTLKMSRIHDIVTLINKQASPAAYTIFSAVVNPELDGDFRVSILAHGFRET